MFFFVLFLLHREQCLMHTEKRHKMFYIHFLKEVARGGERTRVLSISFIFSFSPPHSFTCILYRCHRRKFLKVSLKVLVCMYCEIQCVVHDEKISTYVMHFREITYLRLYVHVSFLFRFLF
jgi:hypothetical protein